MASRNLYTRSQKPYLYIHPELCPLTVQIREEMDKKEPSVDLLNEISVDVINWINKATAELFRKKITDQHIEHRPYTGTSNDLHTDALGASLYRVTLRIAPSRFPLCGTFFLLNSPLPPEYYVKKIDGENCLRLRTESESDDRVLSDHIAYESACEVTIKQPFSGASALNGQLSVFRDLIHGAPPNVFLPHESPQMFVKGSLWQPDGALLPPNMF